MIKAAAAAPKLATSIGKRKLPSTRAAAVAVRRVLRDLQDLWGQAEDPPDPRDLWVPQVRVAVRREFKGQQGLPDLAESPEHRVPPADRPDPQVLQDRVEDLQDRWGRQARRRRFPVRQEPPEMWALPAPLARWGRPDLRVDLPGPPVLRDQAEGRPDHKEFLGRPEPLDQRAPGLRDPRARLDLPDRRALQEDLRAPRVRSEWTLIRSGPSLS
jgi:hypothetical protein